MSVRTRAPRRPSGTPPTPRRSARLTGVAALLGALAVGATAVAGGGTTVSTAATAVSTPIVDQVTGDSGDDTSLDGGGAVDDGDLPGSGSPGATHDDDMSTGEPPTGGPPTDEPPADEPKHDSHDTPTGSHDDHTAEIAGDRKGLDGTTIGDDDQPPVVDPGEGPHPQLVHTGRIRRDPQIPVCWENLADVPENEQRWVREAIAATWEAASAVEFTGWGQCGAGADGIRILRIDEVPGVVDTGDDGNCRYQWTDGDQTMCGSLDPNNPRTQGLGTQLDGRRNGMALNHTFTEWSTGCSWPESEREECLRTIAVHEFGHALGFAHEHNRPDRDLHEDPGCSSSSQGTDPTEFETPYDRDSVMNYCNPIWSNDGVLSIGDEVGVRSVYGPMRDTFPDVRFADFDGDGHDDLFAVRDGEWLVSYAGTTNWHRINTSNAPADQLVLGDFDGNGRADVWYGDGETWRISYGGDTRWSTVNTSSYTADGIRIGDFDGDGADDIFKTNGKAWSISRSATSRWEEINTSGVDLDRLLVGDFDGNGRADVWYGNGQTWRISYDGTGRWQTVFTSRHRAADVRLGDLDGDGRTDVFRTDGEAWRVAFGATGPWVQHNISTLDVAQLTLADVDGDGRDDVVYANGDDLVSSDGGVEAWELVSRDRFGDNVDSRGPVGPGDLRDRGKVDPGKFELG